MHCGLVSEGAVFSCTSCSFIRTSPPSSATSPTPLHAAALALHLRHLDRHDAVCSCRSTTSTTGSDDEPQPKVFYNPDSLQGLLDHLPAIYRGLRGAPQIQPDLVVGHMSYGTMLYLRNLYDCPFVGYYELLPPPFWGDGLMLRKEFPPPEGVRLFNASYHTLTHLHLHDCDAGYTPTHYQLAPAPTELRHKIQVIFDGIDCRLLPAASPAGRPVPRPDHRPDTTGRHLRLARPGVDARLRHLHEGGQEDLRERRSRRGLPHRRRRSAPTTAHELHHIGNKTFKQWVLSQDNYDLSKFLFLGLIPPPELATAVQPERPAHLPDGAVRAVVVDAAGDGVRLHGPGLGDARRCRR